FFLTDTAPPDIHTLSLHDALPIWFEGGKGFPGGSVVVSPGGQIVLRGPLFEEAVLTYDIDLDELTRARAEIPKQRARGDRDVARSEEHTSELQSRSDIVCRLLLEK